MLRTKKHPISRRLSLEQTNDENLLFNPEPWLQPIDATVQEEPPAPTWLPHPDRMQAPRPRMRQAHASRIWDSSKVLEQIKHISGIIRDSTIRLSILAASLVVRTVHRKRVRDLIYLRSQ